MNWKNTTRSSYIDFSGGLYLLSSTRKTNPGRLADCRNFEISPSGGYRPSQGYEPLDGQTLPSEVKFQVVVFDTGAEQVMTDDVVTCGSASGIALIDGVLESGSYAGGDAAGYIVVLPTSGTFAAGSDIVVSGSTVAGATSVFVLGDALNGTDEQTWSNLATAEQMDRITQVPGSGDILGVVKFDNVWYAFRNSVGGGSANMYESTSTGWSLVTTPTLSPNGKFRFIIHNFFGHSGAVALYGCDGKNKGFQFDGTTFTQINTGMTSDKPTVIAVNHNHLFFGFTGGSLQASPTGDPLGPKTSTDPDPEVYEWTAITGAAEIGLGEEIVAMEMVAGTLVLWTEKHIQILYGSGASDWALELHANRVGATAETVQMFGAYPVFMFENSLLDMQTSQAFGDFKTNSKSRGIDPLLERDNGAVLSSCVIPWKSQYRLFYNNGLIVVASQGEKGIEYMLMEYPIKAVCCSPQDNEVCFGSEDGYVYKMDSGNTFAGAAIPYFMKTLFSSFGPENVRILLRKLSLGLEDYGGHSLGLKVQVELGKTRTYTPPPTTKDITSQAGDGYWNASNWNVFYWQGSGNDSLPETRLTGIGTEVSFVFYSDEKIKDGDRYTLAGATLYYSNRGLQR